MKFYDKHPRLKDQSFLTKMLVDTVYSTMALENQSLTRTEVEIIIQKILENNQSHNGFSSSLIKLINGVKSPAAAAFMASI